MLGERSGSGFLLVVLVTLAALSAHGQSLPPSGGAHVTVFGGGTTAVGSQNGAACFSENCSANLSFDGTNFVFLEDTDLADNGAVADYFVARNEDASGAGLFLANGATIEFIDEGQHLAADGTNLYIHADKGFKVNSSATAKPTCNAAHRGVFWYVAAANGVKDDVQVCAKDVANAYAWRVIY